MYNFDKDSLRSRLEKLSAKQRSSFALGTVQRLLLTKDAAPISLLELITISQNDDPRLDDDTIAATMYALQTVHNENNVEQTILTAQRAYEYADTKAGADSDQYPEPSHPTIQKELEAQERALKDLEEGT
jgi:hypothetical protein